jgi:hypothetical protein
MQPPGELIIIHPMAEKTPELKPNLTRGARVEPLAAGGWHLEIPAGLANHYRLAQVDDYRAFSRRKLPWRAPLRLSLQARVSATDLPGTWGFGLWNDPFSLSMGLGGAAQRFPALPEAAWFFFASPPNYLSFRDDLPAQGFLAQTFCSPHIPSPLLALAAPGLGLAVLPGGAQLVRRVLRGLVKQSAALTAGDVTEWHTYTIDWQLDGVIFGVDGRVIHETPLAPQGPLGLVLWIDNQYAALPPKGRLRFGRLAGAGPPPGGGAGRGGGG